MSSLSLEQVTGSWPHGMIVLDNDSRVVHWNKWMERASGVATPDAVGRSLEAIFDSTTVGVRLVRSVRSALQDGTSAILTRTFSPHALPLYRSPGDTELMHISIRVRSVRGDIGKRICLLDIHDETASARRDDQMQAQKLVLEEKTKDLAEANQALDFFVRHAAHDLRAPLRGITTFSELLREDLGGELSSDADDDLRHIENSAKNMAAILEDLLDLSRSANMVLELAPVSLEGCIDRVLESLQGEIKESGATIERAEWPEVYGNERLLTQLVQNLLQNALLHSADGDTPPEIRLTVEEDDGLVSLGIQDNGPGIPEGSEEHIWEPFKSLSASVRGTGLGLTICQKIISRHGGKIWCESEVGRGAHFKFALAK